jgi:hypothetical protein
MFFVEIGVTLSGRMRLCWRKQEGKEISNEEGPSVIARGAADA